MNKLTLKDVKIIGEGPQIKEAILQRYNSLEEFYEQHKITNIYKTFYNYLSQAVIISDTFKCKITLILDVDYPSLFVTKKNQIKNHVQNLYNNIDLYEDENDQKIYDYLISKCKKENMPREEAMMYRAKARTYYDTNMIKECIEFYNHAIEVLPKDDINYKVFFHCELAYDLVRECSFEKAEKQFKHIEKLIKLHIKSLCNNTLHCYYYWRGIHHRIADNNTLAIDFFNKALGYATNNIQKLNALSNIGYSYKNLEKHKKALKYYNEALDYHDESNILATASVYNNIANLYRTTKDYNNAIINIEKALGISEKTCRLSKLLVFTSTYAEIKMDIGDNEAYKIFLRLLLDSKNKNNYRQPYVLIAIRNFIKYLNDIPCLEEYADIIIELKDASNSEGYIDGLVKCLGYIFDKIRKITKGVYDEKA